MSCPLLPSALRRAAFSVKCDSLRLLGEPQQPESLGWRSGKIGFLLLRVPFLHVNDVPVAAVLPVEIELLQQLNPFLLRAHTVHRGGLFQERHLNVWEKQETPDGKPAAVLGMDTNAKDLLEKKKISRLPHFVCNQGQSSKHQMFLTLPTFSWSAVQSRRENFPELVAQSTASHSHFPVPTHTSLECGERFLSENLLQKLTTEHFPPSLQYSKQQVFLYTAIYSSK